MALAYVIVYPFIVGVLLGLSVMILFGYIWNFVDATKRGVTAGTIFVTGIVASGIIATAGFWTAGGGPVSPMGAPSIIHEVETSFPGLGSTDVRVRARIVYENIGAIVEMLTQAELFHLAFQALGVCVTLLMSFVCLAQVLRSWAFQNWKNGRLRLPKVVNWAQGYDETVVLGVVNVLLFGAIALALTSGMATQAIERSNTEWARVMRP